MMIPYLEYEEYEELSLNPVEESMFNKLVIQAQRKLDYITYDRVKELDFVPDEVKEVMTIYIDKLSDIQNAKVNGSGAMTSYSNGTESISFRSTTEKQTINEFNTIARQYLPDYLTYRGVNFDVKQYLQSENDNTQ